MFCRRTDTNYGAVALDPCVKENALCARRGSLGEIHLQSLVIICYVELLDGLEIPFRNAWRAAKALIHIPLCLDEHEAGKLAFANANNVGNAAAKISAAQAVVDIDNQIIVCFPDISLDLL